MNLSVRSKHRGLRSEEKEPEVGSNYCWVMYQVRFIVPLSFPNGQAEAYVPGMLIVSAVPFLVPDPAWK